MNVWFYGFDDSYSVAFARDAVQEHEAAVDASHAYFTAPPHFPAAAKELQDGIAQRLHILFLKAPSGRESLSNRKNELKVQEARPQNRKWDDGKEVEEAGRAKGVGVLQCCYSAPRFLVLLVPSTQEAARIQLH